MLPSRSLILLLVAALLVLPIQVQAQIIPGEFDHLPFGPETGVFHITHTPPPDAASGCRGMVRENHTAEDKDNGAQVLVAVNDMAASCASKERPGTGNNHNFRPIHNNDPIKAYMMPRFDNVTMADNKNVTMDLHMYTQYAGGLRPVVTLTIGNWTSPWTAPDPFFPHASGQDPTWHQWTADFGIPPTIIDGRATISFTAPHTSGRTLADYKPHGGRVTVVEYGVGIAIPEHAGHQTTLSLPFAVQPVKDEEPDEPETLECPGADGSNVTVEVTDAIKSCDDYALTLNDGNDADADGNITDGNVTTNEDDDGNGDPDAANNTTLDTDEQGLPGFGTAMVIVATGLIALIGHQRRLQTPRRR